jgi:phospholipid-translocating ATPase
MEFKMFTAGDVRYGVQKPLPKDYPLGCTNVNFDDEEAFAHLKNTHHPKHDKINKMREALGICHTVVCETKTDEATQESYLCYNASSPDELALVNGARYLGFKFEERDEDNNLVCSIAETD